MRKLLDNKLARFEELERQMNDPAVLADSEALAAVAREHGSLAKLCGKYRRFKELNDQIREAKEYIAGNDPELRELALAEEPELMAERETIWEELLDMTIGGEDANRSRCIMEIHAGTGGDEASLFARDLYGMYRKYCESKNWKLETMSMSETEVGGFKEIVFGVDGEGCYRELQFESGGHRVQRVPKTETQGRIHTSAASVAVLAEPEEVEIDLKPEDYEIDRFCASGPGGQHVNKTSSAIRLTHKETKRLQERKSKLGSGDRSDRIRTYNFPENRVTDHRIGLTLYKLDAILAGDLSPVVDALLEYERQELRTSFGTIE